MNEEIKELLFLLHNYRLTEAGKRKLEQEIERLGNELQVQIEDNTRLSEYIEEQERHIKEANTEIERLNNIINELEKDLIEYFEKEYPDGKLEDYNLENCTYDYALVILGKLQELKGSE